MRRLYLMRHGKAEAGIPPGGDRERALTGRGRRESRHVGAFCRDRPHPPTLILCSPARRTVETCVSFCEGFGGENLPRRAVDSLYMGSPEDLLRAVVEAGGTEAGILVIGHNPGLHALALALGRHGPGPAFARLSLRFPTAALAVFETGIDRWAAFRTEGARLVAFRTAKEPDAGPA